MQVEIHNSITEFDAREWNNLAGNSFPFLKHEFLAATENTGCVSKTTGWSPKHLGLYDSDGKIRAAMPLYEKSHSWGEFVFDWSWAQAYQRVGIDYYPKLISAIPFTPAPSSKLLLGPDNNQDFAKILLTSAIQLVGDTDCSSLHVLFPKPDELPVLRESGLHLRKDCQFHWNNKGYRNFDTFLAKFSSAKRKKVKRERRRVAEDGITFRWLHGEDVDRGLWNDIYQMISITFLRRGASPYFSLNFFLDVSKHLPRTILLVLAERKNTLIAVAMFYEGDDILYGRYWGSDSHYHSLHFETCYYQGIDYCIANNKKIFEPGAQGEHKLSRGFLPTTTWSAHWLARPEFYATICNYLSEESRHIDRYIDVAATHGPYRTDNSDTEDNMEQ